MRKLFVRAASLYRSCVPERLRISINPFLMKTFGIKDPNRIYMDYFSCDNYLPLFTLLKQLHEQKIIRLSSLNQKQINMILKSDVLIKKIGMAFFLRKFILTYRENKNALNINGAYLYLDKKISKWLSDTFFDTFLFHCFLEDDYSKHFVEQFDSVMKEGPYCYTDNDFDVTVKENDVVIDAGAWIGDFSAYAACKGAVCYAFEPIPHIYNNLEKTAALPPPSATLKKGVIHPVQFGLSDKKSELNINVPSYELEGISAGFTVTSAGEPLEKDNVSIPVKLTTLDDFVQENNLTKVDFIKSDIEGAERLMLRGAFKTLKHFAPKLAICTYHLPNDPQVLESLIKEANPAYKIIHTNKKLFACV